MGSVVPGGTSACYWAGDPTVETVGYGLPPAARLKELASSHRLLRRAKDRALGVGEFLVAAVVAASVDELLGGGEISLRRLPRILLLTEHRALPSRRCQTALLGKGGCPP